jgi:hypothetical protein
VLAALGIFVLLLIAVAGGSYNHLVKLSQGVDSQFLLPRDGRDEGGLEQMI